MNLHSKSAVARCLQEHSNMGLELSSYITGKGFYLKKSCNISNVLGDTWIQLTASTLSFTKMFLTLLEDCMRLKTTELIYTIDETLYSVFEAQIRHTENSLRNELNQDVSIYIIFAGLVKCQFIFSKGSLLLEMQISYSTRSSTFRKRNIRVPWDTSARV